MLIDDWTPVAGGLPDDDKLVLMAFHNGEVWPGFREGGTWREPGAMPVAADQVSHWMDLPPAPAQLLMCSPPCAHFHPATRLESA